MKYYICLLLLVILPFFGFSQPHEFKTLIDLEATDVISQGKTGTCWSFSTSSFLESEIIRLTGKQVDLSEMYHVHHTYKKKAQVYVMRQGKAQFSEGGLAHDVMNSIATNGLVPNYVYTGLRSNETGHNHSKLADTLKTVLDIHINKGLGLAFLENKLNTLLDNYLGKTVNTFTYQNIQYTPLTFMDYVGIKPKDYVTITSFNHEPYYSHFILNIPDNFSNGHFYNVKLDELIVIINNALKKGYTIELDCDVSENTFSSKYGLAVIPEDEDNAKTALTTIQKEKTITAHFRQQEFENYNTTDDHLMHITGMLQDQNGTVYYKVKNSWGKNSDRVAHGGYIYMSEAYVRLKTISVMIHKDALPKKIKRKLGI